MGDVFLSYSHVDSDIADAVESNLTGLGIAVFRDVKEIEWGESISARVRGGLERAVAVLVILSPASLKSQWVPFEVGYGKALHKRVLPFLTQGSIELPCYMGDLRRLVGVEEMREYLANAPLPNAAVVPPTRTQLIPRAAEARVLQAMPELISDLRGIMKQEGAALVREIVIVPNERVVFSGDKKRFRFFEDKYEDLKLKFDLLEEFSLVYDVTISSVPIYRMTEDFVDWVREVVLESD
ncbi:toll/interleukin-1 receptor domain-containing protein [bacterium]|nr:toll/interleukin-1 receptor domain-containing protein [bacterium]